MRALRPSVVTAVATVAALTAVTGCAEKSDGKGGRRPSQVTATDDSLRGLGEEVPRRPRRARRARTRAPRSPRSTSSFPDDRIVTERENIGPGTKAKITAEIKAGTYEIACKPGMKGDGIRQKVTVDRQGTAAKRDPELDKAVAALPQLRPGAGRRDAAQGEDLHRRRARRATSRRRRRRTPAPASAGSAPSRSPSPSVTSTRRSTSARTAWRTARSGPAGTGWRRRCGRTRSWAPRRRRSPPTLDKDLLDWQKRVGRAEITPTSMANGAKELLDEVATGKVTGEEERYSHTDLVDFKANVEGAEKAYELLKPVASKNDAALTAALDKQFAALNTLLDKYRRTRPPTASPRTTRSARRTARSSPTRVNALAEPLSKLAAAVAK